MGKKPFYYRFTRYGEDVEFLFIVVFDISDGKPRGRLQKNVKPLHYIKTIEIYLRDELVCSMVHGVRLSKNPLFGIFLHDVKEGDTVMVKVIDNYAKEKNHLATVHFRKYSRPRKK